MTTNGEQGDGADEDARAFSVPRRRVGQIENAGNAWSGVAAASGKQAEKAGRRESWTELRGTHMLRSWTETASAEA